MSGDAGVIPSVVSGAVSVLGEPIGKGVASRHELCGTDPSEVEERHPSSEADPVALFPFATAAPVPATHWPILEDAVLTGAGDAAAAGHLEGLQPRAVAVGPGPVAELLASSNRSAVLTAAPQGIPIGGHLLPKSESVQSAQGAQSLPPAGVEPGLVTSGMRIPKPLPGSAARVDPTALSPDRPDLQQNEVAPLAGGLTGSTPSTGVVRPSVRQTVPKGFADISILDRTADGLRASSQRIPTAPVALETEVGPARTWIPVGSVNSAEIPATPSFQGVPLIRQSVPLPSTAPASLAEAIGIPGMPTAETVASGSVSVQETSEIVLPLDGIPRNASADATSVAPDLGGSSALEGPRIREGAEAKGGSADSIDRPIAPGVPVAEPTPSRPVQRLGRGRSSQEGRGVPGDPGVPARGDEIATSPGLRPGGDAVMPDRPETLSRGGLSPESGPLGGRRNPVGTPEESTSPAVATTPFGPVTVGGTEREVPKAAETVSRPVVRTEVPQGETLPRRMEIETLGQGRLQLTLTQAGSELRIDARELGNALSGTEAGWQDLQKRLEGTGVILSSLESAPQDGSFSGGRNPHDLRHAACYDSGMNFSGHRDSSGNPKARRATPAREGTTDSDPVQRGSGVGSPGETRVRGREWWA